MITKVHVEKVATYKKGIEFYPRKINFIYGSNGTGKSTLSKLLGNEITSQQSFVEKDMGEEEVVVYNREFVDRNFRGDTKLRGIFTLGETSIEIQNEIEEKRKVIENEKEQRIKALNSIEKIAQEQKELREEIEQKCWNIQKKYGAEFPEALIGFRGRMKNFCDKCIEYAKGLKKEDVIELDELKEMYQTVFSKDASKDDRYRDLPIDDIAQLNSHVLLGTSIVGKSDTSIGTFIEYLQASDWVKTGIDYAKKAQGKCPYCQQKMSLNIQKDIESYFDRKYEEHRDNLISYESDYKKMCQILRNVLDEISEKRYLYIDYAEFDIKKDVLLTKIDNNLKIIQSKLRFLSEIMEIESIYEIASELSSLVRNFNLKIDKNNELIEDLGKAKEECRRKIWSFLTWQCIGEIENFNKKDAGKQKGKEHILLKKKAHESRIKLLEDEIENKESLLTTVRPTVNAINQLLKQFGFNGFMLKVNDEKKGTYKIVRTSGEDASKTLSEGEHNFISFLYFYYLCFGSQQKTGLEKKKILIIDDPISSMDSNILFIVSTLVKNIIRHCKNNEKGINQVVILTHNVYFHKEITYWGNKEALPTTQTRYFVLRKENEETSIYEYEKNPIKTSYELLWKELKNPNIGSANMLLNVMRRILEHYFMVVGGIDYEKCINLLEGTDKIICKALVSFINDGSHSVFEDLIFTSDDGEIENYKRVFKLVFEKLGHIEHYEMMMNKE